VGIVLGSGLSPLAEEIRNAVNVPYDFIEGMPRVGVEGHQGSLILGRLAGVEVVCLSGRAHLYEGHSPSDVVFGVRLMTALGIGTAILTNAAGGIAPDCGPGTLMLISDHLNLTGRTPLLGPNDSRWGPRFPDMSRAYDAGLRDLAREEAQNLSLSLAEGVYAGLLGPTYETPAEIRMLEVLGASAVGMSTVLETIALRHRGISVLGISCITNHAAGKSEGTLSHDEVSEMAKAVSVDFSHLVSGVVTRLGAA
jgi:purine-nucleoside phosphorylase